MTGTRRLSESCKWRRRCEIAPCIRPLSSAATRCCPRSIETPSPVSARHAAHRRLTGPPARISRRNWLATGTRSSGPISLSAVDRLALFGRPDRPGAKYSEISYITVGILQLTVFALLILDLPGAFHSRVSESLTIRCMTAREFLFFVHIFNQLFLRHVSCILSA